jgi:hypothetical protein
VQEAKIHSIAATKALRVAPPMTSASSGARGAGAASRESRGTSAV